MELTLESVNAKLTATRAEYCKVMAIQAEAMRLRDDLANNNPDAAQSLRNANRELSIAAGKYEDALREFMLFTDPHRRTG